MRRWLMGAALALLAWPAAAHERCEPAKGAPIVDMTRKLGTPVWQGVTDGRTPTLFFLFDLGARWVLASIKVGERQWCVVASGPRRAPSTGG